MDLCLVYMTAGDEEEARKIGKALVEERLAACVNILGGMNSFYWWDGKIQDDAEAVLLAKTRRALVPDLINRVKAIHSYEVPCIVAVPITDGNPRFLAWVEGETAR